VPQLLDLRPGQQVQVRQPAGPATSPAEAEMLFFVKVRIGIDQLDEPGRHLPDGRLDGSALRRMYRHQADPEVGLDIWEADDLADFRRRFPRTGPSTATSSRVTSAVTAPEAMRLLLESRSGEHPTTWPVCE
jgi:hypothetical protein